MFVLMCPMPAFDYRHLIHKADGERHDEVNRDMYVKATIYDKDEKKTIELKRDISGDGYNKFMINGDEKTKTEYKKFMQESLRVPMSSAEVLFI